jgi:predicted nuclease of predicted toxin-antitoxin system
MRFLADMGVSVRVVEWLREHGHDATHLRDESLQRMADPDVFRKAATEGRILLTFDLDFSEIVALSGQKNVSVALFRLHNTRTSHVIERLKIALEETKQTLESGAIIVIEESRLRVRRLPLRSA